MRGSNQTADEPDRPTAPLVTAERGSDRSEGPQATPRAGCWPTSREARTSQRPRGTPGKRSRKRHAIEWIAVVLFAVLVAGGLRAFVVQAFFVPSGSMLPTLQIGDRIVVIKFGYTIHRGDIVVFKRPPQDVGTTDADLVKRVIGLPGETISSVEDTVLHQRQSAQASPGCHLLWERAPRPAYDIPSHEDPSRRTIS